MLAGKNLQAGETWQGIFRNGRFTAITNIREPHHQPKTKPSGLLRKIISLAACLTQSSA
ncbi:NRDE family protein [Malonomonas rubra]|uniref:NRDE family protein n=1 Tax=Malonomonas rubra TaxID=57040 RepID=UPI0034E9337D